MTPTPIYKDHTGRWREQNPYAETTLKATTKSGSIHQTNVEWKLFEQCITYHEFPNAPEVKPGEVVMAYLQWQYKGYTHDNSGWYDCHPDIAVENYEERRQIWVAANQSEKPFWEKAHDILVEGKEEQAKTADKAREHAEFVCMGYGSGSNITFEGYKLRAKNSYQQGYNDALKQSPSVPKVEVSAERSLISTIKDLGYASYIDLYDDGDLYAGILTAMDAYANQQTSSLQQENEALKLLQDQLCETYDKMTKENDKLLELLKHVRLILPDDKPISKRIDNILNTKSV